MPEIRVLSPHVANQIAAGEVVERPASVVKELVENAVDAHATAITVEIQNGGVDLIRVTDNGGGIPAAECATAFLRHATSKISSADDLGRISSLGFRGEALASIAAIANVTLKTRTRGEELGTLLVVEAGEVRQNQPYACVEGTTMEVRGLFFNVPARLKFQKSARTEAGYIGDFLSRAILALPNIAFHFINNGKTVYQTFGDGDLKNALAVVYGMQLLPHLREICYDDGYLRITGVIGTSEVSRQNRSQQSFFVNGRYIRSFALSGALQNAYDTRLMVGRFPFCTLSLFLAPTEVDVNVHPTKMEVRFADEPRVTRALTVACSDALLRAEAPVQAVLPVQPARSPSASFQPRMPVRADLRRPQRMPPVRVREGDRDYVARPAGTQNGDVPRYTILPNGRRVPPVERPVERPVETPQLFDAPMQIVGVLFETYWIVQQNDDVFLIDQHAAHERRLYEKLMAAEAEHVTQKLLVPAEWKLQPIEYDAYRSVKDALLDVGFETEDLGNGAVRLLSVPQFAGAALDEKCFFDALTRLGEGQRADAREIVRTSVIQSACKHAVKAGEPIQREEIERLLDDYRKEGIPLTCPHGRPVVARLSKLELEKLFRRVL